MGPLIVSGMPRSGTSLMMRILNCSGLKAIADETMSYESKKTLTLKYENAWLIDFGSDHVVKILFPLLMDIPRSKRWKILWMARDPKEQAKSQRKVAGWGRKEVSIRAKLNKKVNTTVPLKFSQFGCDVHSLNFEDLIARDKKSMVDLEKWLGFPIDLSPIVNRSPKNSGLPLGELEIEHVG